jgi:hypothetical protein
MDTTLHLIRAAALRALFLFDPPQQVKNRAAFVATGLAPATATGDAGLHGPRAR